MERAGRGPDGGWYRGRGPGRGVWWCRETRCAERLGRAQVARALRVEVSAGEVDALTAILGPVVGP
jgi:hypothetical protein